MRKLQILFTMLSVLFLAAPAFAQEAAGGNGMAIGLTSIAAGIGMDWRPAFAAWARAGRPLQQLRHWRAIQAHGRASCCCLTLGLAFIESLSLFTLVIIFVKVQSH